MTTQTIKIKNGTITLPEEIQRGWRGADVFLQTTNDTITIKRLSPSALTFAEMLKKFQQAAKKANLTQKDVDDAVQRARKKIYNKN